MSFLIRFNDGYYNLGPDGTDCNGWAVGLSEATRYSTRTAAEQKAKDLCNGDGSAVEVIEESQLVSAEAAEPVSAAQALRWLHENLEWDGHGYWLPGLCIKECADGQAESSEASRPSFSEFMTALSARVRVAATKDA